MIILTLLAQQYGLTVEDLVEGGHKLSEIEVEKPKQTDINSEVDGLKSELDLVKKEITTPQTMAWMGSQERKDALTP